MTVPDQAARDRIRDDLGHTLFVEAGAGAGKTTALVGRVVHLVEAGVPLPSIAAITFTEKAAAELRHRLRRELGARSTPRCTAALDDLDAAPIGTLHAFARRLLFDHPIEAGLPPGFTVLDQLESDLVFDEEWEDLLDGLLADADPTGGILAGGRRFVELLEFDKFGIATGLRRVAEDFRWNWDLVHAHVDLDPDTELHLDTTPVLTALDAVAHTPVPADDAQAPLVAVAAALADDLRAAGSLRSLLETVVAVTATFGKVDRKGNKQKWKAFGVDALDDLRDTERAACDAATALLEGAKTVRKRIVGAIAGRFVLDGAAERARSGRLEFHDLLVLARRLLTDHPDVRTALHQRYQRLLLDEFQDTDPIQLEIAVRLTAAPDDPAQDRHGVASWRDLVPLPGRLFIVGDPKQSIYRFRRADIAQYLAAADQVGAETERLVANFRSTDAVIDFTNDVFERLIRFVADSQPAFSALTACRADPLRGHGTVSVLGEQLHGDLRRGRPGGAAALGADGTERDHGDAHELRLREAADIASTVVAALRDRWPVADEHDGALRPCRPGDICILLPTRIALPALESALLDAGVPWRAENSGVVYATTEIRQLLLALRAADDPTDELAVVASLRSPLYGCSDVDLYDWRRRGGTWSIWRSAPDGAESHPVAEALGHLRSVAERAHTLGPADLLAAMADERRMYDLALFGPSPRDLWRRLRYVVDQARAWADAGGHGVRRYLTWAHLQASEGRGGDTILPEHDHDAVRVMTIHAAKGLEFPITVVGGLTTVPNRRTGTSVVWVDDTWHLAGRGDDGSFAERQPIDELMSDAERRRLLYVACTRAVDHLVVSLHRPAPTRANADYADEGKLTSAELMWVAGSAGPTSGAVVRPWPPEAGSALAHLADAGSSTHPSKLPFDDVAEWQAHRDAVWQRASRRDAVAATRLADEVALRRERDELDDPGLDKHPVNVDLPPWQRGRYGTSIGRAVHGVLQFCDLTDGSDIDDLARAQCAAEGVLGLHDRVAALARSALAAPVVREVVAGAVHWRELFVAAPIGDRVLEGYVDLLVRTEQGLVIVDYKTDQWSGPAQTGERISRYRTQLAAYGAALESALGEPVVGGILVRCRADGPAEQIDIDDWDAAVADVRRLVS